MTDATETRIDPTMAERFLLDPYLQWANGEGVPVHLDFGHDLLALETGPWDRYDARGCFAHTHGRGDFMANYVIEVSPGKKTRPLKHLYEAFFYVLEGYGSTTVWLPNGEKRAFEWGVTAKLDYARRRTSEFCSFSKKKKKKKVFLFSPPGGAPPNGPPSWNSVRMTCSGRFKL